MKVNTIKFIIDLSFALAMICLAVSAHNIRKNQEKYIAILQQPKTKQMSCGECVKMLEIYAKYQDSLEYGPRKHRARYEDSTRKYGIILNYRRYEN